MKNRFSSRELFELRNNIPVDMLIRDQLQIPTKIRDDVFRFLCPMCNEFQTAVNPATNLARCFRCEKNLNTIDLIMTVKGYGFKDSVLFLKKLIENIPPQRPAQALSSRAANNGRPMSGV
jgi:DNA primase